MYRYLYAFLFLLFCNNMYGIRLVKQNARGLTPFSKNVELALDMLAFPHTQASRLKQLPADITTMFLDLKFNPDTKSFKICEFGDGRFTGSMFSEVLTSFSKRYKIITPYWHVLWKYLQKYKLPVWFIGKHPIKTKKRRYRNMPMMEKFGWHQFRKIGGRYHYSLKNLVQDQKFKQSALIKNNDKTNIKNYAGIIVYHHFTPASEYHYKKVARFQKKYPQFLFVNQACEPFTENKAFSASLFLDKELQPYRPQWTLIEKSYQPKLAQEIRNTFKSSKYVLKPINSNRANGIIISYANQLDTALKKALIKTRHPYGKVHRPTTPLGENYWSHDQNKYMIVEEFCESKLMYHNAKPYDPSMRIFLLMSHNRGRIYINVLNGYWKLPPSSLEDKVSLTKKSRTDPSSHKLMGIAVEPDDLAVAREIIHEFMPRVYEKMLKSYKNGFKKLFSYQFK